MRHLLAHEAMTRSLLLAEEAGHTPSPIIPIWQEIVVGLVAFGLLVFILGKFVWPRMETTFAARVEAIEGGIAKAEQAQEQANQLLEEYRQQLAQARTEAARIRDEARADAAGIKDEILAEARVESERIVTAGREALAAERTMLVRGLRTEVGGLAVDLAERIVGEALADEARQRGTVERFLSELDGDADKPTASAGRR